MFKPQKKHKAQHGGYKGKPSKVKVNSLLNFYEIVNNIKPTSNEKK